MKKLNVKTPSQFYPILLNAKKSDVQKALKSLATDKTVFVVSNSRIKRLHGKTLESLVKPLKVEWLLVPEGEQHKNLKTCEDLCLKLARKGAHRGSLLLAFGGGVVGDITGFVAAIYMRGIRFVQIPTTLLAQIDSSVGGKTGVDLPVGKNLVGSFHQPHAVIIDTAFLKTLPERELRAGFAEVIKTALIRDAKLFRKLQSKAKALQALKSKELANVISACLKIKAQVVSEDERESGVRAILNYGHTLGHAIETLTHYKKFKHGEAIAMGLVFAAHVADRLEWSQTSTHQDVINILESYGLPTAWPRFSKAQYARAIRSDKKATSENIKFILPKKLGKVGIVPLNIKDITRWL